jgi:hypothetical protein
MSTLSQFAGGGIKSIQRGIINHSSVSSTSVTVNAVDTSKSTLNYLGHTGYYSASSVDGYSNLRIALTNSTTVTSNALATNAVTSGVVSFELIEYF